MNQYGPVLYGIMIGSFLNCMLYMLEIVELAKYCRGYWKRDPWCLKLAVVLCFMLDTLCTISICAWVFLSESMHWGEVDYLSKQDWPTAAYVLCTVGVGALVQGFLIHRFYVLSKHLLISLLLSACLLSALAGGASVGVILVVFPTYADRAKPIIATTVWLVSSSVADVSIAISLVVTFIRASSTTQTKTTKSALSRLTKYTIQSGTVTTVLALVVLAIYLARPASNDSAYFSFYLGRAYTLTMLFSLNMRRRLKESLYPLEGESSLAITGASITGGGSSTQHVRSQFKSGSTEETSTVVSKLVRDHDGRHHTGTIGIASTGVSAISVNLADRASYMQEKAVNTDLTASQVLRLDTLTPESR